MVWVQLLCVLLAAGTLWPVLGQSVPTSPCPSVFWYEVDASGNWHGRIDIPAPPSGSTLTTVVELHIDAALRSQNVGTLKLLENEDEVWKRISNGNRRPVQFYLSFPLSWPLPVLRSITSNGKFICIGNTGHIFVTKLILQHILYPTGDNSYEVLNEEVNQKTSGTNYFPYMVPNTQINPVYGVKPQIDVTAYDQGQNVSPYTPCPGLFDYQLSSTGEWYGRISVPNPYPILAVDMTVEMCFTGDVPMITRGSLQPVNTLVEEWNRMKTGEKYLIQYKLEFPVFKTYTVTPPLPTVKSITVNDRVLCSGQNPSYSVLGTLTYHHAIFSDRCTSSSLKCPYNSYPPGAYETITQVRTSSPPTREPTSNFNTTTSPVYKPAPTADESTPKIYNPSTPPYQLTSETHDRSSPKHETISHTNKPSTTTYKPTSHTYTSSTTDHTRAQPEVSPRITVPSTQCGTQVLTPTPLIAFGDETYPGQWPWHVALYLYLKRDITFRCGGSFVGTRSVITAAHCVTQKEEILRTNDFMVYFGRYNLRNMIEEGLQFHNVRNIVVHPSYNGTTSAGDIAVLILTKAAEITAFVRPVCLWGQDDGNLEDIVNQVGLVVGWGFDERDEPTEKLMMVKMPVVSQQACLWSDPIFYSQFTTNSTFCAGYRNGSSVCNGDSGGGMVFPRKQSDGTEFWMLRGIVSHGRRRDSYSNICDTTGYIVFTDIVPFLDWINAILI